MTKVKQEREGKRIKNREGKRKMHKSVNKRKQTRGKENIKTKREVAK
jgi:hypothetical protein